MTRVLVCGGRYYDDRPHIFQSLTRVHNEHGPITCIIHGGATGADTEAGEWWKIMNQSGWPMEIEVYRADWRRDGPMGGGVRNRRMLLESKPDLVVAFPGARGTSNMVQQATARGVKIVEIIARER
jgi:hypothetical protein